MAGKAAPVRRFLPQGPRRRPTARELRSAGAMAARDYLKVAPPAKVVVELDGQGGSVQKRAPKELRIGDLSKRSNRFELLEWLGEDEEVGGGGVEGEEIGVEGDGIGAEGDDDEGLEGADLARDDEVEEAAPEA